MPGMGAYAASKAALEALVKTYATENQTTDVCANLVNPGPIRTAMRARAMPGEDPQTLPSPDEFAAVATGLCLPDCVHSGMIFDFQNGALQAR